MLLDQIAVMEEALVAMRVHHLGDGGVGGRRRPRRAAAIAAADSRVEQVVIVTPDKDLGQCVRGTRVVQLRPAQGRDRRRGRSAGQVRGRAGEHRRLPRAGGRLGRRVPRPARVGREERGHRAGPVRHHRRDPGVVRATGACPACAVRRSWPAHCTSRWPTRCCSARIATVATRRARGRGRRLAVARPHRRVRRRSRPGWARPSWLARAERLAEQPAEPCGVPGGRRAAPAGCGDGQVICGTRVVPLKAAAFRS